MVWEIIGAHIEAFIFVVFVCFQHLQYVHMIDSVVRMEEKMVSRFSRVHEIDNCMGMTFGFWLITG